MIRQLPAWYLAIAVYCVLLGAQQFRRVVKSAPAFKQSLAAAPRSYDRGRLRGSQTSMVVKAVLWIVLGVLLVVLPNAAWVKVVAAMALLVGARKSYLDFARGFAEGRKSAALAASAEYVHGRVTSGTVDYAVSAANLIVFRLLPAAGLAYAAIFLGKPNS